MRVLLAFVSAKLAPYRVVNVGVLADRLRRALDRKFHGSEDPINADVSPGVTSASSPSPARHSRARSRRAEDQGRG